MNDLDRKDTERWLKSLADGGLALVSRNDRIPHERGYLRWLAELGEGGGDPDDADCLILRRSLTSAA